MILAETAVASEGPIFYVVGGWTEAGGGSPLVVAYDARNDTWARLPPYPLPIHHAQAAAIEGTLYVFGGAVTQALLPGTLAGVGPAGWPITAVSFKLAPGAPAWEPIASLPIARGLGGAAVVDGLVHLVGGVTMGGSYLAPVDVYDPVADAYAAGPPLPAPRDHLSVVALDGKVYALAGRSNANGTWDDMETSEALDITNGTWNALAPAPLGRGGQGAGVIQGGRIVLAGGEQAEGSFSVYAEVDAYDPATDSWSALPALPVARHGMAAASWDGRFFVMGGATPTTILSSTLTLAPQQE